MSDKGENIQHDQDLEVKTMYPQWRNALKRLWRKYKVEQSVFNPFNVIRNKIQNQLS